MPNNQLQLTRSLYIAFLLVLFAGWCFICVQWYVCGIKGLCGEVPTLNVSMLVGGTDMVRTGNMAFLYKSPILITNENTTYTLDSLRASIKPGDSLQLTGYYWGSEDSTLATLRMKTISDLLEASNINLPQQTEISHSSREDTLSAYRAFNWVLVSQNETVELTEPFSVKESIEGLVIQFPFASADPSLDDQLRSTLTIKIASVLDTESKITVVGHTDNTGSREVNQQLGLRRAEAIADLLRQLGISEVRMTIKSLGSSEPIATNDTEVGRTANRRVEIKM